MTNKRGSLRVRIKIISVVKVHPNNGLGDYHSPYCTVHCVGKGLLNVGMYRSKVPYNVLVKYRDKWILCDINFDTWVSRGEHRFLNSIGNISVGTGIEHFLLRKRDGKDQG